MPVEFSDVERLVLERWTDVMGLIEVQRSVQDRVEEQIGIVADRVGRWARPLGFEVDCSPREAEIHCWRPSWVDRRKPPRVLLSIGGFCPVGFRKVADLYPYLWVNTGNLEEYRVKEPERIAFAQALRVALGESASSWEADGVEDESGPLGRYLTQYDNGQRARLLLNPDSLFAFCIEHLPEVLALADVIDSEQRKLGLARRVRIPAELRLISDCLGPGLAVQGQ